MNAKIIVLNLLEISFSSFKINFEMQILFWNIKSEQSIENNTVKLLGFLKYIHSVYISIVTAYILLIYVYILVKFYWVAVK